MRTGADIYSGRIYAALMPVLYGSTKVWPGANSYPRLIASMILDSDALHPFGRFLMCSPTLCGALVIGMLFITGISGAGRSMCDSLRG